MLSKVWSSQPWRAVRTVFIIASAAASISLHWKYSPLVINTLFSRSLPAFLCIFSPLPLTNSVSVLSLWSIWLLFLPAIKVASTPYCNLVAEDLPVKKRTKLIISYLSCWSTSFLVELLTLQLAYSYQRKPGIKFKQLCRVWAIVNHKQNRLV